MICSTSCSSGSLRFKHAVLSRWSYVSEFSKKKTAVFSYIYIYIYIYLYIYIHTFIYIYIHRHAFRSSQDSSVWLGLTSREQLMLPECSKHQVSSFAKMLVVWWTNKKYSVLISVLQSAQWINSERISTDTCFFLPRTHQCGSC